MCATATCPSLDQALHRIRSGEDVPTPDLLDLATQAGEHLRSASDAESVSTAAKLLHALSWDWRTEVREAAAEAALHLGTADFDEIIYRLSDDHYESVRRAATEALARRNGTPRPEGPLDAQNEPGAADPPSQTEERNFEILASAATHEIRGVLTSLYGALEALGARLLEAGLSPEVYQAPIEKAFERARFVRKIVDDMKGYAKELDCEFEPENLRQIIEDAHELLTDMEGSGEALPTDFELVNLVPEEITFDASRYQLVQVFENVIRNAVEAMEEQGRVEVSAQLRDGAVEITVADNGIGMDDADLGDAFTAFKTSKKNQGGTGFGLPIAEKIVRAHGGRIRLASADGEGTTATIVLPLMHGDEQ